LVFLSIHLFDVGEREKHKKKSDIMQEATKRSQPRRKILPLMARRTTAEEYRRLRKEARRRRQFRGVKDKGEGASLVWM